MGDRVVARAPVRVCDVGGWTDTWFGSPGQVCSLAVGPGVEVVAELVARPAAEAGAGSAARPVRLVAPSIGVDQWVGPSGDPSVGWDRPEPGLHPLLEHAIAEVLGDPDRVVDLPPGASIEVTVTASVPPGASLGTSAAVVVALLGALDALLVPEAGRRGPQELAAMAHRVETGRAGREAGVQDQWAAALGGAARMVVAPYPEVRHEVVDLSPATAEALDDRLVTVVFGPHDSSAVHGQVSHALLSCDGAEHDRSRRALRRLATLAGEAADALVAEDLDAWAAVLVASTEAQRLLHPGLVGPAHARAIEVAEANGATGWKVNGAGGAGGSLTVVARPGGAPAVRAALAAADPAWELVDLRLSPGLSVE